MGQVVFGMISPHPPLLIPEIGGGRIKGVERTDRALKSAGGKLVSSGPDTVVIITPHGKISETNIRLYSSPFLEGDFSMFGLPDVIMSSEGDPVLAGNVVQAARGKKIACEIISDTFLDHGVMVPLHYLKAAGFEGKVLPIAVSLVSLKELFEFGKLFNRVVEASDKKIAVVASADMSHRLTSNAPSGYSPKGTMFDEKLVELVKRNDIDAILNFDAELAEEAGQDALWSIAILLGILDGGAFKTEFLSYEGPFGVGYMVAVYEKGK
ncbi:MAG: class III extradiol dioxygenase subunit B-like domain-containing protein [Candidatus Margulisiibacteriota bacterium]